MQTNPLTVLIVDDELPLREELRLFSWSSCNAELVGEAENGEEALELCRKLNPDVVITDITMPVMDGMELFRTIKREYPLTQVILLTCHSDFEYARDAVKLGALEYLVKVSLLESDLEHALDKARQFIERDRLHRRSEIDNQRWQLSRLFSRAGDGIESGSEAGAEIIKAFAPILQSWKLEYPIRLLRLHIGARAENEMYVHHELQVVFSEGEFSSRTFYRWVPLGNTDYLFLFRSPENDRKPTLREEIEKSIVNLQEALDQRLSYVSEAVRLFASVSGEVNDGPALLTELNLTRIPASAIFYDNSGTVYESGMTDKNTTASLNEQVTTKLLGQFRKAASVGRDELIEYIRSRFTDWAAELRPEPDELKQWLLQTARELFKHMNSEGNPLDIRMHKMARARTFAELTAAFIRELEAADGVKDKCRKEVYLAKQMIAERLSEPITLTLIAEGVGLSSFYLSRLFREEVGESFNEYVTRLRMDKAIHLLQTTNMKVYEVAEQVGIPSYRYFSVLFRSRTGVSPTDFKKG